MQRNIDLIRSKVLAMAALDEKALEACVKALVERNRQLAYAVILRDHYVDELEKEIDRLCLEFLARQQPVASLLRFAYAAIKINSELERVGDYAESIAHQTLKLLDQEVRIPTERFLEIANLSIPMLREATRAFVDQDAEQARKTIETEEVVDALKSQLNRDLVESFRRQSLPFEALNPLLMIARRLERVSDQARNICTEVLYLCTGEYAKHPGAEVFRILFVDEDNSCRSQMAEAIAEAFGYPKFVFSSAGIEPRPVDPATIEFMKAKGFDLSHHAARAINQVPNLDHYQVIVALAPEAKRAFPRSPRKVVFLEWQVEKPTSGGAAAEVARASYERIFQSIHQQVRDLLEAIQIENPAP